MKSLVFEVKLSGRSLMISKNSSDSKKERFLHSIFTDTYFCLFLNKPPTVTAEEGNDFHKSRVPDRRVELRTAACKDPGFKSCLRYFLEPALCRATIYFITCLCFERLSV